MEKIPLFSIILLRLMILASVDLYMHRVSFSEGGAFTVLHQRGNSKKRLGNTAVFVSTSSNIVLLESTSKIM